MGKKVLAAQVVTDGVTWGTLNPTDLLMENPSPADLGTNTALDATYDYSAVTGITATSKPGTAQIIKKFVFKEGYEELRTKKAWAMIAQWPRCVASIGRQVDFATAGITVDTEFDVGMIADDGTFTTECTADTCQAAQTQATAWDILSLQGFPNVGSSWELTSSYRLCMQVSVFAWLSLRPGAETGDVRLYYRRNTFDTLLEAIIDG